MVRGFWYRPHRNQSNGERVFDGRGLQFICGQGDIRVLAEFTERFGDGEGTGQSPFPQIPRLGAHVKAQPSSRVFGPRDANLHDEVSIVAPRAFDVTQPNARVCTLSVTFSRVYGNCRAVFANASFWLKTLSRSCLLAYLRVVFPSTL